jgi:hypothetical protein
MDTLANMLVILLFLSALFTVLGLLCGVMEAAQDALARPYRRRLAERGKRRRRPHRRPAAVYARQRVL